MQRLTVFCPYCNEPMENPSLFCWTCRVCSNKYACPKCEGQGGVEYQEFVKCEACKGTGYFIDLDRDYPPFVKLKNGSCLRHKNNGEYYKDAGNWEIDSQWLDGKLFSISNIESLNGLELIEITGEEWKKDNKGYI